jgi:hypothetical protein
VLNAAISARKPVVNKYQLGIFVEPDDPNAVVVGIQEWMRNPPSPDWARYERENSWEENARIVVERLERKF